jgi:predicted TIM-barrel fold metal-dependent hydrolase
MHASMSAEPYRIDVHHHFLPPEYLLALQRAGVSEPIPEVDFPVWDVEQSLAVMDRQGIATAMLSLSEPGVLFGTNALALTLARQINEYAAGLLQAYPQRFGAFAVLPLPDVDAALRETEYALDTLHLDGIGLLTHYQGSYLGDPYFEPLFAELNRRHALVFLHPSTPPSKDQPRFHLPPSLYEFPFETTRTVANLLYSGTLERYPEIRFILSHAGGAVPYLAKRLTFGPLIRASLKERAPKDVFTLLQRLYYDVAMSANPVTLTGLRALIDSSHILFGSDYPFMPESHLIKNSAELRAYEGFDASAVRLIERENALSLFPRLRQRQ